MTRRTRRIIFYFFLIFFIIVVPIIIFYAWGYGFDWEEKAMVATGGIYLRSYPTKAQVYINDKPEGKTNRFIRRLIPKSYDLKVVKEDYHPWQKTLLVEPKMVSKANTILLVPFNPKIFLVASDSEEYLSFKTPDKKDNLYYISNNNLYTSKTSKILVKNVINYAIYKDGIIYLDNLTGKIFELDLTSLKSAPFFEQVFPSFNQGKWILSSDNKKLLCQKDKSVEILWLDNVANNSLIRKKGDIEKIDFGQPINEVIWYPRTDEHLIIATDNSILITEIDSRPPRNTTNFISTEKPQIKYDSKPQTLYFLSQGKLYQTEL